MCVCVLLLRVRCVARSNHWVPGRVLASILVLLVERRQVTGQDQIPKEKKYLTNAFRDGMVPRLVPYPT